MNLKGVDIELSKEQVRLSIILFCILMLNIVCSNCIMIYCIAKPLSTCGAYITENVSPDRYCMCMSLCSVCVCVCSLCVCVCVFI